MKRGFSIILLCLLCVLTSEGAESFLRMRGFQQHPIWTNTSEKGKYLEGSTETLMETKLQGWMLSYGMLGLGGSTTVTEFTSEAKKQALTAEWQEGGLIFGVTRTTTLTL